MRSFVLTGAGFLLGLAAGLFATSRDDPAPRADRVPPALEARLAALERPARAAGVPSATPGEDAAPPSGETQPAPEARRRTWKPPDEAKLRLIDDELVQAFATDTYGTWLARMQERYQLRSLDEPLREFGRPHVIYDDEFHYRLPSHGDGKNRVIIFHIRNRVVTGIRYWSD